MIIIGYFLLGLVVVGFCILVLLLFVPFNLVLVSERRGIDTYAYFKVYWLWRIFQLQIDILAQEIQLHILSFRILRSSLRGDPETAKPEAETEQEGEEDEESSAMTLRELLGYRDLIRPLLRCIIRILQSFRLLRLYFRAEVGLSSAAATGIFIGRYYALVGILQPWLQNRPNVDIKITPVFHDEALNYGVYLNIRNSVIRLLIPVIRLLLSRPTLRLIKNTVFKRKR